MTNARHPKITPFRMPALFSAILVAGVLLNACSGDNSTSTTSPASSADAPVPESSSGAVTTSSENGATVTSSASAATPDTVWNRARLTNYTSWPDPGSEECIEYNGCTWAGWFAGLEDQQTEQWVSEHNIIAVHEKDWKTYKLKTLRLRQDGRTIDATVYDMCSDSDCDGCCTRNAGEIGFLIDIEKNTLARFGGGGDGVVEWICLDCE